MRIFTQLFFGLLMSLAFPPVNPSFLAFVALVPLFIDLNKPATFTRTARAGILAGAIFFGVSLSWLIRWASFPGWPFRHTFSSSPYTWETGDAELPKVGKTSSSVATRSQAWREVGGEGGETRRAAAKPGITPGDGERIVQIVEAEVEMIV